MNSKYAKILYLPHHQSNSRKHMSLEERAAQFSPFAALTGYDDQIEDTNRFREDRIELSETDLEELNHAIHVLLTRVKEQPEVEIVYYDTEAEKYITKSGKIKHVYEVERVLVFKDMTKVSFNLIIQIKIRDN
ncbi:MAG: hypothetical protein KBT48_01415 [Firmicutes bacterium]|nr:hypothetical protein [Bacillota bacterium]